MPSLACPHPALIRDLACGRVPADREAELDSHLSDCDSCAALHAEHLRPFVAALRELSTSRGPDTPPLARDVIEKLKQNFPANRTVVRASDPSVSTVVGAVTVRDPNRLGKFRLVSELGRGGMGCVYHARDEILDRDVALKVILLQRGSRAVTPAQRQGLFTEAQAAAKLKHPNIVPVWEAGETDDRPYLAMPLLDGETLAARLKHGRMALSDVCRIGSQVAEGLAAAHDAGLLHRDIKPANLWIERLKNGVERVVVLDFGLARPVAEATGVAGTPAYMAPEQAAGHPLTDRADLFSLGVVLYEMVTGKKLFPGDQRSITDLLASVSAFSAPPTPKFLPGVPTKLAAIIGGLLRNDPARRKPGTAHKLATALAALSVELAPGHARRRWFRVARTAALVLLGGMVVAGGLQCKRQLLDAPVDLTRTKSPKETLLEPELPPHEATIPLSLIAERSAKNLDHLDRRKIARDALPATDDGEPQRLAPEIVAILGASGKPGADDGHTGFVEAVALHPNGAILATGGLDCTVRLWDLSGTAPVQVAVLKNNKAGVTHLAFTTDGKWLVSGAADGAVLVWPVGSETPAKRYDSRESVTAIGVSRTGSLVAIGHSGENIRLVDLNKNTDGTVIRGNRVGSIGLAFTDDNTQLIAGSQGWLRFINLANGQELSNLPESKVWFSALAISPDGTKLLANGFGTVAGSRGGLLTLLPGFGNNNDLERQSALSVRDLTNERVTLYVLKHDDRVWRAQFTSDGKQVVTLTADSKVHLWNWATELRYKTVALVHEQPGHTALCRDMALHPDGRHAIVARSNGQVYVVRFNLKP